MATLAASDPYTMEFLTEVVQVDGKKVQLEETYFYPEGGGQPADRGYLGDTKVTHVSKTEAGIVHELTRTPSFEAGDTVHGSIDAEYRTYLMRAHTASHALYGAGRELLSELGYGGFGITEQKVRVDFETATTIDDSVLVELEQLVNEVVWESRDVTWEQRPRAAVLEQNDVAFNTKTEEGVTGDTVRVVEIDGWDTAACGGTHVRNTREIGPVTVLDRSNPGEGLTRVEFAVGPPAIERRAQEKLTLRRAAQQLETNVLNVPDALERVLDEHEQLGEQLEDLRTQVIEARLSDLKDATITRDGTEYLAGEVPTDDANALAEFAQRLVEQTADVVALVSESGSYVAVATDGTEDAEAVVDEITAEFGGGGGGSSTVAQAGGIEADSDAIVEFLRR